MTSAEVHALIEELRDPRGVKHWENRYADSPLTTHGVGLTKLRKLAKKVGRDHELSRALWTSDLYEARVVALLIDEPKRITREQAEAQVEQLQHGQLAHVFSSCGASLAKAPFVVELAEAWMKHDDPVRRACGYGLLSEIAKWKKSVSDEARFAGWNDHVDAHRTGVGTDLCLSMGYSLIAVGKRSARLNRKALAVAEEMSPIVWDPTGRCEPFDLVKHLDNPSLRAKLGVPE
ncbi:MAG: hypothetical protein GY913_19090 [Proteobacteria bacterium]|nr:hypothetical protein [Pseudomonadota bacterium]MCP4919015.1 hypothetical protein [Pseudomonadota bacterium]